VRDAGNLTWLALSDRISSPVTASTKRREGWAQEEMLRERVIKKTKKILCMRP
jgi:hypothetical protein